MSLTTYAVFPPEGGGLSSGTVHKLLGVRDDKRATGGVVGAEGRVDAAQRRSSVQWLASSQATQEFFSHIFTLVTVANGKQGWDFDIEGMAPRLQLTRYDDDDLGHYDWHLDVGSEGMSHRKVTAVALLSDPSGFTGGALQILRGRVPETLDMRQGSVAVFPSYLLHRVTPVVRGARLSLVGWAASRTPLK